MTGDQIMFFDFLQQLVMFFYEFKQFQERELAKHPTIGR
jgi:hypothetical protein